MKSTEIIARRVMLNPNMSGAARAMAELVEADLTAAGYAIVPQEPTQAMMDSIMDEVEAQEIDPMEGDQKAKCIWRTALHSAATGRRGYTLEEAEEYLANRKQNE